MEAMDTKERDSQQAGQKFFVNIEDKEYPWDEGSITVTELRTLGGLPSDQPVVQELADGTERTLGADETIDLQPGHRYGRAPKYRRG